jgi:hypothetical protein
MILQQTTLEDLERELPSDYKIVQELKEIRREQKTTTVIFVIYTFLILFLLHALSGA